MNAFSNLCGFSNSNINRLLKDKQNIKKSKDRQNMKFLEAVVSDFCGESDFQGIN